MRRYERGSVLVVTMAAMAGLVALMAALAVTNREAMRAQGNRIAHQRAWLMAEAGIQRAIAELQTQDMGHATQNDKWAVLGSNGSTEFLVGNDSFRVQILDAGGRVNLNSATQDQIKRLPLTQQQMDSLLDWRESTKTSRAQGAKDEYYSQLSQPYNTKLKPFDSVDELLLVRGFTPETLYSQSKVAPAQPLVSDPSQMPVLADLLTIDSAAYDSAANGSKKVDARTATADQFVALGIPQRIATAIVQAQGSFGKLGDICNVSGMTTTYFQAIANTMCVGTAKQQNGLINLNTASEAALNSMPNMQPDVARAIVSRQSVGFQGVGDLALVPGVDLKYVSQNVDSFCVSSRSFIVRVIGFAGNTTASAEAILTLSDKTQVQITRMQPQRFWDMSARWGWPEVPASQIVVAERS